MRVEGDARHRRDDQTVAADIAQRSEREAAARRRTRYLQIQAVGVLDAEFGQARACDLKNLDFEHHFGFGDILVGDDFFGQADRVGCVTHDQRIGLFVNEHVTRLQDRLDHRLHLLGVGVDQMKTSDLEVLVILGFGRHVGVDEKRVVRQHFLFQLVLHQDQIDGVLHRSCLDKNCGLQIRSDILVEQDVDAGCFGDRLQHHLEIGVAELQRHGLLEIRAQRGLGAEIPGRALIDLTLQHERRAVVRVLEKDFAQARRSAFAIALFEQSLHIGQYPFMALVHGHSL